ncbi:MAG: DUF4832 domain-containing protein [Anaerolineales bacterium]|nr:DUF4832 domain-containing protein [Anaerolineales bacterium]
MRDFNNYKKRKANRTRRAKFIALLVLFFGVFVLVFIIFDGLNVRQLISESSKAGSLGMVSGKVMIKNQLIKFNPVSGPILNPLMGLSPWATIKVSEQPHTLVYADLSWRDFEPLEGVFDFDTFEKKQQLARWRQEGKRIVFRFVVDFPGSESHVDIPDWLFEKINRDGEFYDNAYGKGFSPNYSNPIFMKYHNLAIKALGNRYGKDPSIAFIELGSLGHWGEWHVSSELEQPPSEEVRDQYVYDYKDAFPDTFLLMRRPFSIAKKLNLGLFNDQTGFLEGTNLWLEWIENGGAYLPGEENTLVPMPEAWKTAPIGGEQVTNISNEDLYDRYLPTTITLLTESHATFIGPGGPYEVLQGSPLQSGIDQVLSTIGYRLSVVQVEMPFVVHNSKEIQIKFSLRNDGIAPFYYDWPVQVYLFNGKGELLSFYPMQMDIRKILPNQVYNIDFILPMGNFGSGKYTIGLAILDPITNLPGIELANENLREDLIQEVGTFEIKR